MSDESPGLTHKCPTCGAELEVKFRQGDGTIVCRCGRVFDAREWTDLGEKPAIDRPWFDPENPRPRPSSTVLESLEASYPRRKALPPAMEEEEDEFSVMKDRVVPIILLLAGLILRVIEIGMDRGSGGQSLGAAAGLMLCQVVLTVAVMLGGTLLSARVLGANFGRLDSAILKLSAIAVLVWACAAMLVAMVGNDAGGLVLIVPMTAIIDFVAFWTLFSLDLQEALATVVICGLLQDAAGWVLLGSLKL